MTDEEFERLATLYGFAPSRPLRELLDAAVKAEREACAQILDRNADVCANNSMIRDVLEGNAAAIRARAQK